MREGGLDCSRRSSRIYPYGVCILCHRTVGAAGAKLERLGKERPMQRDESAAACDATFFIDADGVMRAKNLGPVFGNLLQDGVAKADAGGA